MAKVNWYENENFPFRYSLNLPDLDLHTVYTYHFNELLKDALKICTIEDMPETYDRRFFMLVLLLNGKICCFRDTKGSGDLIALNMKEAQKPDRYYVPSKVLVVNPTFNGYSYTLTPGVDCSVIYCTSMDQYSFGLAQGGLYGLISTTAQLLADNTISINTAQKNMRLHKLLAADDTNTVKSIEAAMKKMYYGEPFQVVQKKLLDQLADIPMQPTDQNNIQQLLQANQYIKAQFYERIGFITHDQMKKERLISSELTEGAEMAIFNILDMIDNIREGIERTNELFGTKMKLVVSPLILANIGAAAEPEEDPEEAAMEAAEDPAESESEDQSGDGEPDQEEDAAEPEAEDQSGDGEPDQEEDAAEPEAEDQSGDGEPDQEEDAAEPEAEDQSGDGEPDQEEDAAELESEDQSGDGEPDQAEPAAEKAAEVLMEAAAELAQQAAELAEGETAQDPIEALEEAAERYKLKRGGAA